MSRGGNHTFAQVPSANIQRSTFDRSHAVKTTFDAGKLIPVFVDEILPGDTFNLRMNGFARMATPLKPIMDNMYLDTHFFAVPIRLIWDNWQKFNGEQTNPDDSTDFTVPYFEVAAGVSTPAIGTNSDYFGIPTGVTVPGGAPSIKINSLFHRALALIWNEWFRDQNLQDSVNVPKDDGPDTLDTGTVHKVQDTLYPRGKRHDYFTSALPWPQKGPDVTLPFSETEIPVKGIGTLVDQMSGYGGASNLEINTSVGYPAPGMTTFVGGSILSNSTNWVIEGDVSPADEHFYPNIRVSLEQATLTTINAMREAFQLQRLYERDARGGTRYVEIIRAHFGVISPDARLQRPEYLGGGSTRINVHPLAQTSASETGSPQGNMAAFGTASLSGHGFVKSFTEHCVVIGLASVRADLTYQEGLNRMFSRRTRFDFYWPALANLGEQEILNKELYLSGTATDAFGTGDEDVFGYQERYAEYRYKPSQITGKFRSQSGDGLDVWHLAQEFGQTPTLSEEFIVENPPIDRIIATPSEPQFLFDAWYNLKCTRPMPVYSVPGLIDHF